MWIVFWQSDSLWGENSVWQNNINLNINLANLDDEIIDYVIENLEPGSIIPISVGIASGTRGDYLYDKLDVLISAILSEGYEIVTVSELFNLK